MRFTLPLTLILFLNTDWVNAEDRPRNARQEANRVWYKQVQPRYQFYTHYNEKNPPPDVEFIHCIRP